ncbi:hypothetical protein DPMN_012071 [Dreissena polymorpha]|uniref:Uncharacterized protein n=1 Tax=Dreissena polymorpha TaxID=45954 RepID=A0A9D4N6C3_DREPO|nr:hypothetical protein DPMN_012071 [Dreissena polymorpha]
MGIQQSIVPTNITKHLTLGVLDNVNGSIRQINRKGRFRRAQGRNTITIREKENPSLNIMHWNDCRLLKSKGERSNENRGASPRTGNILYQRPIDKRTFCLRRWQSIIPELIL